MLPNSSLCKSLEAPSKVSKTKSTSMSACVYLFQTPARIADLYPVNACVRALSKTGPSVLRSDHQRITTPRILATERSCDRSIKRPKGPSPTCATSSPIKWRPITFLNKKTAHQAFDAADRSAFRDVKRSGTSRFRD